MPGVMMYVLCGFVGGGIGGFVFGLIWQKHLDAQKRKLGEG